MWSCRGGLGIVATEVSSLVPCGRKDIIPSKEMLGKKKEEKKHELIIPRISGFHPNQKKSIARGFEASWPVQ